MTYPEGVIRTFAAFGKAADALVFPVGVKYIAASGQNFMSVCLMPHIPHELVKRGIEHIVKGYRHFHYPERSPEMAAFFGNNVHDILAQLCAQCRQLLFTDPLPQV